MAECSVLRAFVDRRGELLSLAILSLLRKHSNKLTPLSSNLALPRKEIKTRNKYLPLPYHSFEMEQCYLD